MKTDPTASSNQMYLFPLASNGVWMIEHLGPIGQQAIDLFGTNIIPSPYSLPTTGAEVVKALKPKNEGVSIDYFDSEDDWRLEVGHCGGEVIE